MLRLPLISALLASFLAVGLQAPVASAQAPPLDGEGADVVVVGGGPTGLAAAIEARLNGAERVVVLEKRDQIRSRVQVLNLRRGTLDNLARLGVPLRPGDNITYLKERTLRDEVSGKTARKPVRRFTVDAARATHTVGDMLVPRRAQVALVSTNVLEHELMQAARRAGGIELRFRTEVTGVVEDARGVSATVTRGDGGKETVRGRLMVVSDGARSATRAALGVGVTRVGSEATRMLGGVFDRPGGAMVQARRIPARSVQSTVVVRLGTDDASGVLVELPPEVRLDTPAEREAYFRQAAALVGARGPLKLPPSEFEVTLERAERVSVGARVFLLGDAARTTHVSTGLGINWGLRDATRFGLLYRRLADARTPKQARAARGWFARETAKATTRLHRRALPLFQNLHPRPVAATPPKSALGTTGVAVSATPHVAVSATPHVAVSATPHVGPSGAPRVEVLAAPRTAGSRTSRMGRSRARQVAQPGGQRIAAPARALAR